MIRIAFGLPARLRLITSTTWRRIEKIGPFYALCSGRRSRLFLISHDDLTGLLVCESLDRNLRKSCERNDSNQLDPTPFFVAFMRPGDFGTFGTMARGPILIDPHNSIHIHKKYALESLVPFVPKHFSFRNFNDLTPRRNSISSCQNRF